MLTEIIKVTPVFPYWPNLEYQLDQGLNPCDICQMGWVNIESNGIGESCHESCEIYQRYLKKQKET